MNQIIVNLNLLIGDLLCSDSNYKFLQRTNEDDLDYKWEDVWVTFQVLSVHLEYFPHRDRHFPPACHFCKS